MAVDDSLFKRRGKKKVFGGARQHDSVGPAASRSIAGTAFVVNRSGQLAVEAASRESTKQRQLALHVGEQADLSVGRAKMPACLKQSITRTSPR
ncbi:hypothetical protein [Streptomyces sp. AK04-3B]|uniref:hypothetical protein n=1 Tax=Streptomyces sp. AK04-3B TaxID=3028650 RepID=UPI0029A39BFF|nr:hypothetical protein [Streptomyces sp. AK04-3B]MDX3803906.1 hypothetical protein [Streptomyces sp. AK04-3B]